MGGKSSETQNQSQSTTPYGPAAGLLNNLLAQAGGLGAPPDRTGMVNDAYSQFQQGLAPTASGQYLDPNTNPFMGQVTQTIGSDVQNRANALYAGSGRDPAGAGSYPQTLGRGIAEGVAPVFAGQYNAERQNQLGALGSLLQGGGATAGLLSSLDQVPLQTLLAKMGLALPSAQAFGTTTGTSTKESNMSPVDQFFKISSGIGSLFKAAPKG